MIADNLKHERLFRLQRPAFIVGVAALALCAIELFLNRGQFFRSYLVGYFFWLEVALGSMGVLMVHHLLGGTWGVLIRRIAEAAMMTLPLMAVLFIPIALGVRYAYPWADPQLVQEDAVLRHRHAYLNQGWFVLRSAAYFAVWILIAWRLRRLSVRQDVEPDWRTVVDLRRTSAPGLVLYFVTMSLAAVDWIMSMESHWYSSIFGFILIVGQALLAFVFMVVVLSQLAHLPPLARVVRPNYLNDLGNFLLTLVILFAYLSFAQLLVTWMGNTQTDVTWYVHRSHGGWRALITILVVLHFFVPFVTLLFRDVKCDLRRLATLCGVLFVLHLLYVVWLIEPSNHAPEPHGVSWTDLAAPIGIGGIWIAAFLWLLGRTPLVPLGEPLPVETEPHDEGPRPAPAV